MQTVLSMKKIRINELARELEVKAHEILDRLPELGVTEKKTHSSSIDEDVAVLLRRYYGHEGPDVAHEVEPDTAPLEQEAEVREARPAPAVTLRTESPRAAAPEETAVEAEPVLRQEVPPAAAGPTPTEKPAAPIRPPLAGRP